MKILVIRHETTVLNEKGLINGQLDDELSDTGKKDLLILVKKLNNEKIDVIYSSPLKRALQTAQPIAKDHENLEIITDKRLMEVDFGEFTGKSWESVNEIFHQGKSSDMLNTYKYDVSEYGGESYDQVKNRVYSFIEDLIKTDNKDVLIVTHGGVIRLFYLYFKNQKVQTFPNGSIHTFFK
jgi:broad specificity phosphatase PhoE